MTLTAILAFAMAMFLFSATPGPGFFATTARVLTSGFGAAIGMLIGIRISDLIFLTLALTGMAAATEAMGEMFIVVKLACGTYLIWLGYCMWRQPPPNAEDEPNKARHGLVRSILDGLIVGLSNPKSILFYAALLPSFFDLAAIQAWDIAILSVIVLITPSVVDLFYLIMAANVRRLFRKPRAGQILRRLGAATLTGVGVSIIIDR